MSEHFEDDEYEARIGTSADEWKITGLLGVGGMAAVYRAVHALTNQTAALKILHEAFAGRQRVTKRFLREAHIANAIAHDGAVAVLGQGETDDGCPYLVMELLEGETVEEILDRVGKLPLNQALGVADQVLSVLSAAHGQGIVHRDIKPENIFITNERKLKLLDFGIARLADYTDMKKTSTGSLMGTPTFMPPEQALGRMDQVGPHTDIWAVGAVIFNLLSGETVHDGESAGEVLVAAASQPARSLATVFPEAPLALVQLVDEALAYDIAHRIPDAMAMRTRIREVMADLTGLASRPAGTMVRSSTHSLSRTDTEPPRTPIERAMAKLDGLVIKDLSERDLQRTVKVWEAIDSALTARLHYGHEHPQASQRFEAAWRIVHRALDETEAGCLWNVTPYSFHVGELTVWEPRDQLDWIPYRAFASGIRAMALVPGLSEQEFSGLLDLLSMDPLAEMAPEDDLVTLLWEGAYKHVLYREVDTFSEGEQAEREEFEEQRREVAAFVRAAKRGGMEIDVGRGGKRATGMSELEAGLDEAAGMAAARAQAESALRARSTGGGVDDEIVSIDPAALKMLRVQLDRGAASTGERFVYAAVHGYTWAIGQGRDADLALALRLTNEAVAAATPAASLQLAESLLATLRLRDAEQTQQRRRELATALMSADAIRSLHKTIDRAPLELVQRFRTLVAYVLPSAAPELADLARQLPAGTTLEIICEYLGRSAAGNEDSLGALIETAEPTLAMALIKALRALGTSDASLALQRGGNNPHPMVRLEALKGVGGGMAATKTRRELQALIASVDEEARAETLPAIVSGNMRDAAPVLIGMIRDKGFDRRTIDDRRQIFTALADLAPERAEPIALEVLTERKLVSTGSREETRVIAAEILARVGRSRHTLESLESVANARFGVSIPVREAAESAAAAVRRRQREGMP